MKISLFILVAFLLHIQCCLSQSEPQIYDPSLDGEQQIDEAITQASAEGKFVLVQVGGNWCTWCRRLEALVTSDDEIAKVLADNFVVVHLNYSKENKNETLLKRLGSPQRFGFPVLIVLDEEGRRLHTQDSGLLESGKGHDREKVLRFLKLWSPSAITDGKK